MMMETELLAMECSKVKPKLYILIGIPGSGKSTYIKNHLNTCDNTICISRDAIRYSLLKDEDEYFAKEDEVFDRFIKEINTALAEGINVYADATHISIKSRTKLLRALDRDVLINTELYAIYFDVPLLTCLKRNSERTGRARVPSSVIRRMFYQLDEPLREEGFKGIGVIHNG